MRLVLVIIIPLVKSTQWPDTALSEADPEQHTNMNI